MFTLIFSNCARVDVDVNILVTRVPALFPLPPCLASPLPSHSLSCVYLQWVLHNSRICFAHSFPHFSPYFAFFPPFVFFFIHVSAFVFCAPRHFDFWAKIDGRWKVGVVGEFPPKPYKLRLKYSTGLAEFAFLYKYIWRVFVVRELCLDSIGWALDKGAF